MSAWVELADPSATIVVRRSAGRYLVTSLGQDGIEPLGEFADPASAWAAVDLVDPLPVTEDCDY